LQLAFPYFVKAIARPAASRYLFDFKRESQISTAAGLGGPAENPRVNFPQWKIRVGAKRSAPIRLCANSIFSSFLFFFLDPKAEGWSKPGGLINSIRHGRV